MKNKHITIIPRTSATAEWSMTETSSMDVDSATEMRSERLQAAPVSKRVMERKRRTRERDIQERIMCLLI